MGDNNIKEFDKNSNINDDNEEKFKKIKRKYKGKESIYYKSDIENNYLINRTFDVYGKDNEEKENEYNNDDSNKTYISKISQNQNNTRIKPSEENSQILSSTFINALTQELYGSSENTNTFDNNDTNDSNKILELNSSKSIDSEKEEKSKALIRRNMKGRSLTNKIKKPKRHINKNKTGVIKPKVLDSNNNNDNSFNKNKKNNLNLKIETDSNINKEKQNKINKKSIPKYYNKSKDRVSNFKGVYTPYNSKKVQSKIDKEKEKAIPKSNKTKSNEGFSANLKSNINSIAPYPRKNQVSKFEVNQGINNSNDNLVKVRKKYDLGKKHIMNNNSMSNLNVISSRSNINKSFYEKGNNKELISILKDVNDDYANSIEMLRRQEEQIKNMLRFIEQDEK